MLQCMQYMQILTKHLAREPLGHLSEVGQTHPVWHYSLVYTREAVYNICLCASVFLIPQSAMHTGGLLRQEHVSTEASKMGT